MVGGYADDPVPGRTLLGGDDHDTVGTSGAVNGRSGGVLQHVDGLDIVRVQGVEAHVHHRHAIYDQQRIGIVHGSQAPDLDGHVALGITAVHDIDTGHPALEQLAHVGAGLVGEDRTADTGNRAGQVALLDVTVTDHHRFVQQGGTFFHDDLQEIPSVDGHFHIGISHTGNPKYRSCDIQ